MLELVAGQRQGTGIRVSSSIGQGGGREKGFYAEGSLSSSNSSVMEQGLISVTNVGGAP